MLPVRPALTVILLLAASVESAKGQPSVVPGFPIVESTGIGSKEVRFFASDPVNGTGWQMVGGRLVNGDATLVRDDFSGAPSATLLTYPINFAPALSLSCVGDFNANGMLELSTLSAVQQGASLSFQHDLIQLGSGGSFSGWPLVPTAGGCPFLYGPQCFADIDGDGADELVIVGGRGPVPCSDRDFVINALNSDGTSVPGFPIELPYEHRPRCMAVGDLEFDGDLEIVVGTTWTPLLIGATALPRDVFVFEHTGALRPGWPVTPDVTNVATGFFRDVAIGDLDNDGVCEIVGCDSAVVSIYAPDGTVIDQYPGSFGDAIALGDLDNDDHLEIVVGGPTLSTIDPDTEAQNSRLLLEVIPAVSIADSNGDGLTEIAVFGEPGVGGNLRVMDASLQDLPGFPINYPQAVLSWRHQAEFLDHDGDGDLELGYTMQLGGTFLLELAGEGTGETYWNAYGGNQKGTKYFHEFERIERFTRGDADGNGALELADVIVTLSVLFQDGAAPCMKAIDADDSDALSVADAIAILAKLFVPSAPSLPHPSAACGRDATSVLSCTDSGSCP